MKKFISTSQFLLLIFHHEQSKESSKEQSKAIFLAQLLARLMSYWHNNKHIFCWVEQSKESSKELSKGLKYTIISAIVRPAIDRPKHSNFQTTDLDIIDLAIHGVVCQKSVFRGNSDIQNYQKLDPLEITAKKLLAKIS